MKTSTSILRPVIIALVVLILAGLAGWYYFVRRAETQTSSQDQASGYDNPAPSFQGSTGSTNANVISTLGVSLNTASNPTSRLWEVSQVPVAGFGWIAPSNTAVGTSSQPVLYFVERSSGNVLEADTGGENVMRLTDTLFPKIYQAFVSRDGSIIERSIDDAGAIDTFSGTISSSTETGTTATSTVDMLQGADLPEGIVSITDDPISDTLYYLIPGSSGVSLVSTDWSGDKEKSLFSSSLADWRLIAPGDGSLVLLQSPLDGVQGYAYELAGGALSPLAEGPGLTVLTRASSSALIFGTSQKGTLALFAQASAQATPTILPIQTVADKCAWAPGAALIAYCGVPGSIPSQNFLDDWYKGIVHTSDEFYMVDASDASTTLLYNPIGDTSAPLDVEDPVVDPSGQYIAFINGADQSLWVLRIAATP